jgi:solute:Na+ symporter, SSS family
MLIKSVNAVDYVIVVLYLLSMVAVGLLLSRSNKNDGDYFKGGNKIPWIMAGISLFIGQLSAYMFVAASGQAYSNGISCLLLYSSGAPVLLLVALFFAHKWRRTRITSPIEYIGQRYGKPTRKFYTFVQIPIFILMAGNCLYILCIFLSSALRLQESYSLLGLNIGSIELCIIITGIVITLYTSSGGLWAVIITDTVQFLIVMLVSILILILSFRLFSAESGFVQAANEYISNPPTPDYFRLTKQTQPLYFTIAWFVLMMIVYPTEYGTMQRCFSVPNERDAKKLTLLAAVSFLIVPLIWIAPVVLLRKHLPDMSQLWPHLNNPAEASYVTISLALLPNGVIGLTLSAILAASMSSMSTVYNFLSSIVTENVYKPIFAPGATPKQTMQAGKWITLMLGGFSIVVAIILSKGSGAFETTFSIASYVQTAVAFPLLVGLFVKRVYRNTAIISSSLCFVTNFFTGFLLPRIFSDWDVNAQQLFTLKIFAAVAVSIAVYLISHILYCRKPRQSDMEDEFFAKLNKPISEDGEGEVYIPNLKMYNYVAWSVIFYAAILLIIHLTSITEDPGRINLLMAVMFFAAGLAVKWLVSPRFSPFKVVRQQYSK